MNNLWIILVLALPSIPVIAFIDYQVFSAFLKCPNCDGRYPIKWWYYSIPTFLEILLFIGGIAVGMAYQFK